MKYINNKHLYIFKPQKEKMVRGSTIKSYPLRPTHPIFVWSSSKKCVCAKLNPLVEKSRLLPLKGVIPLCKKLFYKYYNYNNATFKTAGTQSSQEIKNDASKQHLTRNVYKKKDTRCIHKHAAGRQKKGKQVGCRVERQIENTAVWLNRLNCPFQTFWMPEVRTQVSRYILDTKQKKAFNSCVRNLESKTESFWKCMWKEHLIPYQAQICVGDVESRNGTKMDFKCRHTIYNYKVGLEIKANKLYRNECTPIKMSYPFEFLTDSPLNQDFLQSLRTWVLHDKTYPNEPLKDYLLIYLDETGATVYHIPIEIQQCRDRMNQIFLIK